LTATAVFYVYLMIDAENKSGTTNRTFIRTSHIASTRFWVVKEPRHNIFDTNGDETVGKYDTNYWECENRV